MKKLTFTFIISILFISCSNKLTVMKRKYSNGFFIASSKKLASKTEQKNTQESLKKHEVIVVQHPSINHESTNFVENSCQDEKDVNSKVDVIDNINLTSIEHKCLSHNKAEIKITSVENSEKTTISEKKLTQLNKSKNQTKKGFLRDVFIFLLLYFGYSLFAGCFIALIFFFILMDPALILSALVQFILGKILVGYGKRLNGA